jgi:hypothetical protein
MRTFCNCRNFSASGVHFLQLSATVEIFLPFSAVFCSFLQLSAVFCSFLQFSAEVFCRSFLQVFCRLAVCRRPRQLCVNSNDTPVGEVVAEANVDEETSNNVAAPESSKYASKADDTARKDNKAGSTAGDKEESNVAKTPLPATPMNVSLMQPSYILPSLRLQSIHGPGLDPRPRTGYSSQSRWCDRTLPGQAASNAWPTWCRFSHMGEHSPFTSHGNLWKVRYI